MPLTLPLLLLLPLAGPYGIDGPPAPLDSATRQRLDQALALCRSGAGEEVEQAVRQIALIGEGALPAVVERLNAGGPGERMVLLHAVSRIGRAAPLRVQAATDPHPAVRALVAAPARAPPLPDLRRLASEYVDLLAVADHARRADADEDLRGRRPPLGRDDSTFAALRRRLRDRRLADAYQAARQAAALALARAGAEALREGRMRPDLGDPAFVAYAALLREEEPGPLYHAMAGLVAVGEPAAPALVALLQRHDPRRVVPLLIAVGQGRELCLARESHGAEAQAALVQWAARVLPPEELLPWLERAAESEHEVVRSHALDALLDLPSPAGIDAARRLFAIEGPGGDDTEAARLLARAGEVEPLAEWVRLAPLPPEGASGTRVAQLRRASLAALRKEGGAGAERLGAELMASESGELRLLGLEFVRDEALLFAFLAREPEERLAEAAVLRVLDLSGPAAAPALAAALGARGLPLSRRLAQGFRRAGAGETLVGFAEAGSDEALAALGGFDALPPGVGERLLAIHAGASGERRVRALAALVPLGSAAVRERVIEAGDAGIEVLAARTGLDGPLAFSVPLLARVAGADASLLRRLGRIAAALPEPEPGLFLALLDRWEAVAADEPPGSDSEGGPVRQRILLVQGLARARDGASVAALFRRLLEGRLGDIHFVLPVLEAAARHLSGADLAPLLPLVLARCAEERPLAEKRPPPYDEMRRRLLWGGINALALKPPEGALAGLLPILFEPSLQPMAFDWQDSCPAPSWVLEALRHFPADAVSTALAAEIGAAEEDGRLAAMHPETLFRYVKSCREGRDRGRLLPEVALLLGDVLDRLPFDGEVAAERISALATLGRWKEAAEVARRAAAEARARGRGADEGFWTPRRLDGRAAICDAMASGDGAAMGALAAAAGTDPIVSYLAAWNHLFALGDLAAADTAAAAAAWGTGALYHAYRDMLGMVRVRQGRPQEALWWFDPQAALPIRRPSDQGARHLLYQAKALIALGETREAQNDLERAIREDRRLLAEAQADPDFAPFAESFRLAEEEFLESLFRWD